MSVGSQVSLRLGGRALIKIGCSWALPLAIVFAALLTSPVEAHMMFAAGAESGASGSEASVNQAPQGNGADDPDPEGIDMLLESEPSGSGPLESSGWTSFDLGVLAEPFPDANEEGEEVAQPNPQNAPANPAEDAPLHAEVGMCHFPYTYHETVGGGSFADTHRRFIVASSPDGTPLEFFQLTLVNAQDRFEAKASIIRKMHELDPEGGWGERGAQYLLNAHTPTGEEPLERLVSLGDQLQEGGAGSEAFAELKNRRNAGNA